jgi:hypothetical protein
VGRENTLVGDSGGGSDPGRENVNTTAERGRAVWLALRGEPLSILLSLVVPLEVFFRLGFYRKCQGVNRGIVFDCVLRWDNDAAKIGKAFQK